MSATACSGNAELSTTMALIPPVSATSVTGAPPLARRPARTRWMTRATSVEPVKTTPCTRASATSAAPASPAPGSSASASRGTPASCSRRVAAAATSGVSSAGLARTALPDASAAATCPVKIANGKFQGEMQATAPSGGASGIASAPAA